MQCCKSIIVAFLFVFVNGCAAVDVGRKLPPVKELPSSYALQGTTTALVGIAIDKNGVPLETVKEVVLRPGEKALFAGPDRFQVVFKNQKAPNEKMKYESQNGVIVVTIPKDILSRKEFVEEFRKNESVQFNYSILVNGKELDPPMVIKRDY